MRNRFRRAPLLIVAVIMVILSGRTAVVADTPLDESGRRGVHYLADSEEYPGTACRYNGDNVLMSLRVRDPFVFAADHPKGQVVGWRVLVQANDGSAGGWSTVARSRIQLHGAVNDRPANFEPIRKKIDADAGSAYRVLVRMIWYRTPVGQVLQQEGRSTHRVDWYRYPLADANPGFCPGGIL